MQYVFALKRNQLTDLNGCATQAGKPRREPSGIRRGKQRASKAASFTARESSESLRGRAYSELSRC